MRVTERQLNRATLARQLLLEREPLSVLDAIKRVVALQAQEAASPYLALWNRVAGFDARDLHDAYVNHDVVKASLMRITLHAVHAEDYPSFHAAMVPSLRASRLHDNRFKALGLTIEDADEVVPEVLAHLSEPRTGAEIEALLSEKFGELPKPGLWWALRTFAPVVHAPTSTVWTFVQRPAYVAARTKPLAGERSTHLERLALRYLEGFGPASVADLSQFTLLTRAVVRETLQSLGDRVRRLEGPGGVTLFDVPLGAIPSADVAAPPRLMAMWDSTLLAYTDRSRIIPPDYRQVVIQNNGDVLPTVLVDGYVAGVWRAVEGGIEVTAFHKLSKAVWDGLACEATALAAFLADRDPKVYSRYQRWWTALADRETRALTG